jgi:hypothetical protein
MTAENVADRVTADGEVEDSGYEPELKRTLGSFQLFAISFAFISVAVELNTEPGDADAVAAAPEVA